MGRLERAPLRGGHTKRVSQMHGVGDMLLTCDGGGVLLAWHVPTCTLLRRLGRDVFTAPPARGYVSALALTARSVATVEDGRSGRSQTRLFDWLP